ncbi:putative baseplate assembly protein [Micromonospora sagamiensis]|uniref:Putative phage baseplate assembly protein n=1 Tax=Micromonospora sagamiensis TaxID=47875 RepID=A0A562WLC7_9ACTN|nr:putative baseplate assembly protein [Micromonospora sagamiensis]TWJ31099.1 putative phage baseplate assembly protein [Micromonospora sagamiensis]BCL15858.1 putative baseplate assembly protein [Micromonospora sagamiensis]
MALPAPALDDRGYDDLVGDARQLIADRCPEWTDLHPADPGVTLIETFASLTDQLIYRLNRVPDRLYVKFLDLVGVRLVPPTAARTTLTFWLSTPARATQVVPAGTQAVTVADGDEPLVFTTLADLTVPPCALTHLRVRTADGITDQTAALEVGGPVVAFSAVPQPGDELLVGLDRAVGGCAVRLEFEGRVDGVGVNPLHPPLRWEARDADGWRECEVSLDSTGALNRPGAILLHVPEGHQTTLVDGTLAGWLRARVVPPEEGQPGYRASPVVLGLAANTVGGTTDAVHADLVDDEEIGDSEGVPGQRFPVSRRPVLAGLGDPVLEVASDDGWQPWTRVDHFAASGPDDPHFLLDGVTGEVVLGPAVRLRDGTLRRHGAVPPRGSRLRLRRYAVGGGSRGNVGAGAVRALRTSIPYVAGVENRHPAGGGVDGETLDEARRRGPLTLRSRDRAVTAEDHEVLAREAAPELARVRCVPSGGDGPPVARILVVPAAPAEQGRLRLEDLIPAEASLARVAGRLDETRLIGTRVVVEPPRYRGVTVVARVVARPRVRVDRVREEGLAALYGFLSPMIGGGPDGRGWPFGRPVQAGELFAVLQRVRGVELVEDLRLFGANPVTGERGAEAGRIDLEPDSLVFSFEHQLRVEEH